MKQPFTLISILLLFYTGLHAQSTGMRVYQILQDKCVQCHSNASPEAGLDLEGSGPNVNARAIQVYNNIVNTTPANATAAAKGHKYIYPGRADLSFLFRKINQGLEPTLGLDADENQSMPPYGQPQLSEVEKELIRQWIFYGAPLDGEVVEETLLEDYYSGNKLLSFPDGPPEAPAPDEGFQIKMGPFYLAPTDELEYFQKYELDLPEDVDVTRLDIMIGTYSHHMIVYDFEPGGGDAIPDGLRLSANHANIGLVAAVQEPTDLKLPQGTAFIWDKQLVLDLNSHYINYSASANYQAESYINVYTQPSGTAAQEMHTELLSNFDIYIPNNGDPITHSQHINYNLGDIYLWGIMGHTHQYGTGYKAYERLPGGQQGEIIYDASCARGIPGCISPYFDYQHIPMRYFEPLKPLSMTSSSGLIHEASWLNDGPEPVAFGPTSEDEMMVMVIMYTESLDGVVSTDEPQMPGEQPNAYPNPANHTVTFKLHQSNSPVEARLLNINGQTVLQGRSNSNTLLMDVRSLSAGVYIYQLRDDKGGIKTGKLVVM